MIVGKQPTAVTRTPSACLLVDNVADIVRNRGAAYAEESFASSFHSRLAGKANEEECEKETA